MTLAGYETLPGTPLTPGTITIPKQERDELAEVLGDPPPEPGTLHPLHAFIAAQRGIGASIADLCAYADFPLEDGPMMGTLELELREPMRPDVTYRVEGEVVDLVRKQGRTHGTFDLLTYRERLLDPEDRVVAEITNSFVLVRKDHTDHTAGQTTDRKEGQ